MSSESDRTRSTYVYAGLAILFWSTVPTAFKISLRELDILTMLTIASITSTCILFIFILTGRKISVLWTSTPHELLWSATLGLINPFVYYIILLNAYRLLPAQVAQPLNMIWPIMLVFLSVPFLHQKIHKKNFIALLISFAGVYLISSQGSPLHPGHANFSGVVLALASSIFWSFYFILNVRDKRDEAIKLFLNFFFASLYFLISLVITNKWPLSASLKGITASVYLGFFEMGISFMLWLKALQFAPSTAKVSNLVYLAPVISLLLVHFILHEPVYYTTPIGLMLIISGIFVQNSRSKPST